MRLANTRAVRAARALGTHRRVEVVTSFLGAHALPPEANGDKDAYIATVCEEMLPAVAKAGLADAVDGFCEGIAFTPQQIERVFEAAKAKGLLSEAVKAQGLEVLGWRKLTPCNTDLGKAALDTEPVIEQIFLLVKDDPAVTDVEQLVSQGMNGVWRQ